MSIVYDDDDDDDDERNRIDDQKQTKGAGFDGAAGLRLFPDRHVHRLRRQDAQPARKLQRGQIHRLRHVHDVRHLGGLCAHLLRLRVQDHHALLLRLPIVRRFLFCWVSQTCPGVVTPTLNPLPPPLKGGT